MTDWGGDSLLLQFLEHLEVLLTVVEKLVKVESHTLQGNEGSLIQVGLASDHDLLRAFGGLGTDDDGGADARSETDNLGSVTTGPEVSRNGVLVKSGSEMLKRFKEDRHIPRAWQSRQSAYGAEWPRRHSCQKTAWA